MYWCVYPAEWPCEYTPLTPLWLGAPTGREIVLPRSTSLLHYNPRSHNKLFQTTTPTFSQARAEDNHRAWNRGVGGRNHSGGCRYKPRMAIIFLPAIRYATYNVGFSIPSDPNDDVQKWIEEGTQQGSWKNNTRCVRPNFHIGANFVFRETSGDSRPIKTQTLRG